MADTGEGKKEEAEYKRLHTFPLIRVRGGMDYAFTSSAAKMIKETMDKKFGSSWHVVTGEGFGFEIAHEVKNLLYMFFGGSLAMCVWKCS
ncbi:DNAL4 protein, partial [Eolophus roseicapillus]|nr:DNAL4 protein [Eolophus roseicapilla]